MEMLHYIIAGLGIALVISLYFNFKFGMIVLRLQDSIENSLELLDDCYGSITQTLQTPLFFDNAEVRKVLADIDSARNAVLNVANQLASIEDVEDEDEES